MKGFGSALWFSRYSEMALLSSATLLKVPPRMRFRVISAKKRSTMLCQDAEVGMKFANAEGSHFLWSAFQTIPPPRTSPYDRCRDTADRTHVDDVPVPAFTHTGQD